jgi:tRNA(adenine34) deaminase
MSNYFLAPGINLEELESLMREALAQAELSGKQGELPIGAVVVVQGQIVARGRAQHKHYHSDIRHAELNSILEGGEALWQHADEAMLVTTVEPCVLCLGAAVMADIPHIIFALPDGVVQSDQIVETNPYVRRHLRSYFGGVLRAESRELFRRYDPTTLAYIEKQGIS